MGEELMKENKKKNGVPLSDNITLIFNGDDNNTIELMEAIGVLTMMLALAHKENKSCDKKTLKRMLEMYVDRVWDLE